MNVRIKKKSLFVFGIISTIFLFMGLMGKVSIEDGIFYFNLTMAFLIIAMAQFSLMSLIAIISNYMLANIYFVYKTGTGYGLLALTSHIYMKEIAIIILIFNISILLWIKFSDYLQRENHLIKADLNLSKSVCEACGLIAIMMAYIAFPEFKFGISANRFQALLPGHFWNHFMIVFLLLSTYRVRESHLVKVCIGIVTFWVLFHGERVDIIGFYAFLLIRYCVARNYRLNVKFTARFGVIIVMAFMVLVYIGESRVNSAATVDITKIAGSFFSQGTASDVGYVFNSSIDYVKNRPMLMGKTFITYIQGIIPFLDQPYRAGMIIHDAYKTVGGEYFLVEPYINFGMIGIVFLPNMLIFCLNLLMKKKTAYKSIVYCFLVATVFRYVWYGLTYIETGLLYLLPTAYIFISVLEHKPKIREKSR